jgi:gamma-glutamylputrescine oxidase
MAGLLVSAAILDGDDQYRLFAPFGPRWAGGIWGRMATQLEYWRLQYLDRRDEKTL